MGSLGTHAPPHSQGRGLGAPGAEGLRRMTRSARFPRSSAPGGAPAARVLLGRAWATPPLLRSCARRAQSEQRFCRRVSAGSGLSDRPGLRSTGFWALATAQVALLAWMSAQPAARAPRAVPGRGRKVGRSGTASTREQPRGVAVVHCCGWNGNWQGACVRRHSSSRPARPSRLCRHVLNRVSVTRKRCAEQAPQRQAESGAALVAACAAVAAFTLTAVRVQATTWLRC